MLALILVILTCLINLSLGFLVLLRNPKHNVSVLFFLVTLGISVWAISNFLTGDVSVAIGINKIANRIAFFAAFLAVTLSLRLTIVFPDLVRLSPRANLLLNILTGLVAGLSLTSWVAGDVIPDSRHLHFTVGPLLILYIMTIAGFLVAIIINLFRSLRKTRGHVRQQALFMLIGFGLPILLALITNAVLPSITESWQLTSLGPAFTIILVGTISFAIIKHRLFDLRLAVARSFAYALSIIAMAILFALVAVSISTLFLKSKITVAQEIVFAVFSALSALAFQPLKHFFDKLTNQLFYRDAYDPQAFFNDFNEVLVSTVDLDALLNKTARIIANYLRAQYCLVGIKDASNKGYRLVGTQDKRFFEKDVFQARHLTPHLQKAVIVTDDITAESDQLYRLLSRNDIALLVRLTADYTDDQEGLGYIILGPKKSGNPYNHQDSRILEAAANELIIAIQNAMRFEEIENFNLTLQEKIDDATRKLRRVNDKLRRLNETKDDFISMASHQLRTPLTSVKGYVSMVLDGDAGKITRLQRKLLNQSFVSAQRMVYLISDLLNVSRLKTGKFIIEPIKCNLARVVQEEIDQLQETAKGRHLELIYQRPEHFPALMLDETKLRQVIMNFLDNAVYYTPAGGHISVNLAEKPQSVEFTVVDDGIGVPKYEQHHLFSKFFRAPNAKRARPDGTGLGLFMAKKVIIAQGGAIIFKSQEGRGSTFGFTFAKAPLLPEQKS